MLTEFKQFILRGNVIDLAVAVVIGAAFGAIVTSLVENIITPLIGALGGQPDFSGLTFTLNNSEIRYGAFLNALISFLIIAAVIFFAVTAPGQSRAITHWNQPTIRFACGSAGLVFRVARKGLICSAAAWARRTFWDAARSR